ncbi:ABC transporter substrate-binding protein [Xylophilus sp. GOD-11R]|uniref:ABC transporter substrate-binding protein n=1 Tax=Xylophilus sp. GOD-11R TaxID=3089814 RepID=UPI00298C8AEE|nr:ABC transporter substrate-binding protein [Xylophilus sp. GOD-11R]WPB57455.1 ABC transporter substrate-binding protein [Xylophilus sp. GOD-11R]
MSQLPNVAVPRVVSRRQVLQSTAAVAGAASVGLAAPAFAQGATRNVKFTLPWLAQGATDYVYIAEEQGLFKKRGISVQISRGFGSLAAAQAIGAGQFDFGLVSASSTILSAANGLPLVALATTNYEAFLGLLVRADSPIRSPKDLEGKRMGGVPASVEFPLWRAFAKRAGVDDTKVSIVQADPRVVERTLVDKQIDAYFCVASTSYAVCKGMDVDTRAILLADYGLPFYSNNIVTRQEVLERDPGLCRDVTEALLEALAFTVREPDAALDIFLKKVPELTLTKGGRENARLSQGFMLSSVPRPESMEHGLGWSDMNRVKTMTDLVMDYAAPSTAKRPDLARLFTNQFAGTVKLSPQEWTKAQGQFKEFPSLLKS